MSRLLPAHCVVGFSNEYEEKEKITAQHTRHTTRLAIPDRSFSSFVLYPGNVKASPFTSTSTCNCTFFHIPTSTRPATCRRRQGEDSRPRRRKKKNLRPRAVFFASNLWMLSTRFLELVATKRIIKWWYINACGHINGSFRFICPQPFLVLHFLPRTGRIR